MNKLKKQTVFAVLGIYNFRVIIKTSIFVKL